MPAKSKAQQKFMGAVYALKKGDIKPSDVTPAVRKVAKDMKKSDAKDFASTKHKGLPRKVKQEILNKLKEYASKMGTNTLGGDDYTTSRKGGLRDFDGYDNVDYNKDMPMDENISPQVLKVLNLGLKKINRKFKGASLDGKTIDIELHPGHNRDSEIYKIYDLLKKLKLDKHRTSIFNENVNEFFYMEFKKWAYKNRARINRLSKEDKIEVLSKAYLKKYAKYHRGEHPDYIGAELLHLLAKDRILKEGKLPNNWMQGRTSDYHTAKKSKEREYDDTNFDKEHSGQPDLEEDGMAISKKNYADWKSGRIKKEVLKKLKEYAQNQDLSYILDKDAKLDGTPEDKMAIDEVGLFPIQNYVKGIIPSEFINSTTPQKKERLKSTLRDLKNTLNKFWKSHNIPYRVR